MPLSLANLHGVLAHVGAGFAGLAALLSALAFLPRRTPALNVREMRNAYLTAEEDFTKLRLLDTRIFMYEKTGETIARKADLVIAAVAALGLAVILTVIAGIVS